MDLPCTQNAHQSKINTDVQILNEFLIESLAVRIPPDVFTSSTVPVYVLLN